MYYAKNPQKEKLLSRGNVGLLQCILSLGCIVSAPAFMLSSAAHCWAFETHNRWACSHRTFRNVGAGVYSCVGLPSTSWALMSDGRGEVMPGVVYCSHAAKFNRMTRGCTQPPHPPHPSLHRSAVYPPPPPSVSFAVEYDVFVNGRRRFHLVTVSRGGTSCHQRNPWWVHSPPRLPQAHLSPGHMNECRLLSSELVSLIVHPAHHRATQLLVPGLRPRPEWRPGLGWHTARINLPRFPDTLLIVFRTITASARAVSARKIVAGPTNSTCSCAACVCQLCQR